MDACRYRKSFPEEIRRDSKGCDMIPIEMLRRPNGATIGQMIVKTGCQV